MKRRRRDGTASRSIPESWYIRYMHILWYAPITKVLVYTVRQCIVSVVVVVAPRYTIGWCPPLFSIKDLRRLLIWWRAVTGEMARGGRPWTLDADDGAGLFTPG